AREDRANFIEIRATPEPTGRRHVTAENHYEKVQNKAAFGVRIGLPGRVGRVGFGCGGDPGQGLGCLPRRPETDRGHIPDLQQDPVPEPLRQLAPRLPRATSADEHDLVHISVNMTLRRVGRALSASSDINNLAMDLHVRSAYDDCLDLLDGSVDHLARSLIAVAEGNAQPTGSTEDVVSGSVKEQMKKRLKDLSELVSNSLAIYAAASGDEDFVGIPTQNRRRLMSSAREAGQPRFPEWLRRRDRALLEMPAAEVQADIVVAKDGSGTYTSIEEAIKKAPEHSDRRTISTSRQESRYEEGDLKVGRKKTNLMFIGDGKGKTVITGGKSAADKITTFHTASFGSGFIARDMTFENYAGPSKHQAVALRVGADHAVVYRCEILGYQDTSTSTPCAILSRMRHLRDGRLHIRNAAVVLQNCNIYSRKPMASQRNTITAQNRKDPNQNTGISIHACKILATPDLEASKGAVQTYLGRPWKMYSRTVYMLSSIGGHVDPRGWLEWNGDFALDTLYYGEYMNNGPGAGVGQRVKWPGYQVITSALEASKFTVAKFIYGSSWLPSTGVAFIAGLSE
ncbi:hypothetical protein C3L33_03351, partial [Rhododendron williamsianum]